MVKNEYKYAYSHISEGNLISSTDELIKQLRHNSKTTEKALQKQAKPLTAELCGIEIKCP